MDKFKKLVKDSARKLSEAEARRSVGELFSSHSTSKKSVKIRLNSASGDKLYHNALITCSGVPTAARGSYRWYRMNASSTVSDSESEGFEEVCTSDKGTFEANDSDSGYRIACMWIPHAEVPDFQPSNMAEIGPLQREPTVFADAQSILDSRKGRFEMVLPSIDSKQPFSMAVDCRSCKLTLSTHSTAIDEDSHFDSSAGAVSYSMNDSTLINRESLASVSLETDTMTGSPHSDEKKLGAVSPAPTNPFAGSIWAKAVKIKPQWYFEMSRENDRLLTVMTEVTEASSSSAVDSKKKQKKTRALSASSGGSVGGGLPPPVEVFRAIASNARDRDIFCIVIGALARKRREKREAKLRGTNLLQLDISYIGDSTKARKSIVGGSAKMRGKLNEKDKIIRTLKEKSVTVEKERTELSANNEKLGYDLERLRVAGSLKREQINKLTKENRELAADCEFAQKELSECKERLEDCQSTNAGLEEDLKQMSELKQNLLSKEREMAELKEEMSGLMDDKKQMQQTLNHLNVHVSKVQTERTLIDDDLSKISDEKIRLKSEAREAQLSFDHSSKQLAALRVDYDSHIKMCKFDVGQRDSEIARLQTELEQSTAELNSETEESTKHRSMIQELKKKVDRATHKNAKLKAANEELESRLTESVLREEYELLKAEHFALRKDSDGLLHERNEARGQASEWQRQCTQCQGRVQRVESELETSKEELQKLQSHNLFWRNKVNSLREELQKLYEMQSTAMAPTTARRSVAPTVDSEAVATAALRSAEVAALVKERDALLSELSRCQRQAHVLKRQKELSDEALDSYKRALETEMTKTKRDRFSMSLFKTQLYGEDLQTQIKKNRQLQQLANEFSDIVVDKEQVIKHMKAVNKFLGLRVKEVEDENNGFRKRLEMEALKPQRDEHPSEKSKRRRRRAELKSAATDSESPSKSSSSGLPLSATPSVSATDSSTAKTRSEYVPPKF